MTELEKIVKETSETLGVEFTCYRENERPANAVVCERPFEKITDDGTHTFFRFYYKGEGYVGVLLGTGAEQNNYATLLPAYIESSIDRESELSKTEYLKRILLGECSSLGVYKYATRYSVRNTSCFALVLRLNKVPKDTVSVIEQYGGNSLDTVVKTGENTYVLVKFLAKPESEYSSPVDYAEFLAQSLKEELGIDAAVGVGSIVRDLKDISQSYSRAENALRYAEMFEEKGSVHSYREFFPVKILEDVPARKLETYLYELLDDEAKEIFSDEELLFTAEEFLRSNLNVSEASRNLYMHRNTLLYRLDKIERATGLNIRDFSDAVSFRVLTVICRLLGK